MGAKKTEQRKAYKRLWAAEGARLRAVAAHVPPEVAEPVSVVKNAKRKPIGDKKSRHRIVMPARVGASKPMICRMPGCSERLRYRQRDICCSPYCRERLRELCEMYLSILDGERLPEELPYHFRTRGKAQFLKPQEISKTFYEENKRESKSAQARRLREDGNQRRWYPDVPAVRATKKGAKRAA